MTDDAMRAMQAEIDRLRAEVARLDTALAKEASDTTRHIEKLYMRVAEINEFLWPLVHKVFPDFAADARAIEKLMLGGPKKD